MPKSNYEAECVRGLETFAAEEIKDIGGQLLENANRPGALRFRYGKSLTRFKKLRVVSQVFAVHYFEIPRPKALLGSQSYQRLSKILNDAIQDFRPHKVESFRLEAAGKKSAIFQRLIQGIERDLKLYHSLEVGDLFLRVVPAKNRPGWEVLVRQSVRPLATRSWRQFNYKGALAAPVAAAMLQIAEVNPNSRVLNLMSGSGTLLAENDQQVMLQVGLDLNDEALRGSRLNLGTNINPTSLVLGDAIKLPVAASSVDVVLSDLPWGQLVGDITNLKILYPAVLNEAYRVAAAGARFVIVTQLKKQMRLAIQQSTWRLMAENPLKMDRVNPAIYLLKK